MNIETFYKLFRVKPTVAWSVGGIILGTSVAINEYGWNLHWKLLFYVFFASVIIQAFLAHAINDLIDEEVDKKTDIKGTKRAKVLLLGLASRIDLFALVMISLAVTLGVAGRIYIELGWLVLVFYAIGIYAPLAYSLPPLKLGWRPFSEWTVVFPVLIALVVGTNFVATGKLSGLALLTGIIFALFNIVWFIVSRMMDYYPDKEAGKRTSIVKFGIGVTADASGISFFVDNIHAYLAAVSLLLFWVSLFFGYFNRIFIFSLVFSLIMIHWLPRGKRSPIELSIYRTYGIAISIIHTNFLSAALIFFR